MKHYDIYQKMMSIYKELKDYGNPPKWYSSKIKVALLSIAISALVYSTLHYICNGIFQLDFGFDTKLYTTAILFVLFRITCDFLAGKRQKNNLKKLIEDEKLASNTSYKEILYPKVYKILREANLLYGSNKDIELMKLYISVLEREQLKTPAKPSKILGLGIIIAILAPLWNQIIEKVLSCNDYSGAGYGYCIIFSIFIIYALYALYPVRNMYFRWLYSKRIDIENMINWLYDIKVDLEINSYKVVTVDTTTTNESNCIFKRLIKFLSH